MKTTDSTVNATQPFQRRYYQSFSQYWQDLSFLIVRPRLIYHSLNIINHAFRERIMMVVTEVNQCRYCKTFHSKLATHAGVSNTELQHYAEGQISPQTPPEEIAALQHARQWAEHHAEMDIDNYRMLEESYDAPTATAIDLVVRLIWIGNLSGNTWDYWLYRLSFGRLGQ